MRRLALAVGTVLFACSSGPGAAFLDDSLGQITQDPLDSGTDAGTDVCAGCPTGSRCTEEAGCSFVCQSCTSNNNCPSADCHEGPTTQTGYCVRRLPGCVSCPAVTAITLESAFSPCSPADECNVSVVYSPLSDAAKVGILYSISGGADAGLYRLDFDIPDAGKSDLWQGLEMCCYDTNDFSPVDWCVSHATYLRVRADSPDASVVFDYNLGGGILAPRSMDAALVGTFGLALAAALDAGFSL